MHRYTPEDFTPGLVAYGHPEHSYRSAPGLSSTQIKSFTLKSPAHFHHELTSEPVARRQSDALLLGSMVHCLVLEPGQFDRRYPRAPRIEDYPQALQRADDLRDFCRNHNLKVGGSKEELTERILKHHPDTLIWSQIVLNSEARGRAFKGELIDQARRMADSVLGHPQASRLLSQGEAEVSVWGEHPGSGELIKCRCDWLRKDSGLCIDLKTTDCASPAAFSRSIGKYGYHLQQAHYLATLNSAGIHCDAFVFIAVENEPPYVVQVYCLDRQSCEIANNRWDDAMTRLHRCQSEDVWPAYTDETSLSLPAWMIRQMKEFDHE